MLPLPDEIVIGPWRLRVIRDDAALYRHSASAEELAIAGIDTQQGFILLPEERLHDYGAYIDPGRDELTVSLMHEVLHGCFESVDVKDNNWVDSQEKAVELLALTLVPVLRNNPALVRFITGDDEDRG